MRKNANTSAAMKGMTTIIKRSISTLIKNRNIRPIIMTINMNTITITNMSISIKSIIIMNTPIKKTSIYKQQSFM